MSATSHLFVEIMAHVTIPTEVTSVSVTLDGAAITVVQSTIPVIIKTTVIAMDNVIVYQTDMFVPAITDGLDLVVIQS